MADATALDVPADLAQVAEEKGIPLDLVRRGLALGFPADAIKGQLGMPGVTAEAAEQFISEQERIRAGGEITIPQELLEVAQKHEWPESHAYGIEIGRAHARTPATSASRMSPSPCQKERYQAIRPLVL